MKDFNFAKMVERSIATGESVTVSYPFNGEADYEEKSPIIDVKPVSVDYSSPPPICIRDQQAKSSYGANMIKNYSDSAMHNRRVSRLFRGNRFTKTWDCLQSLDYKSELRRDLVNRMMQSREHLLSVLKIMHPNGYCDGDLFIDGILTFSLRPGSCGYWTKNSVGNNFEHCAESAKTIDIESYVVMQRGIPRSIAFNDLSRMGNLEISEEKCFAYDCKPGWSLKASFDKSKLKSHRYEMDPLRAHGFRIKCMHPYLNYDDSIHHFVCDFESPDGEVVKSPLTLWESPNGDCVFDWLHPPGISPLYNLNQIYQQKRAILVCENEAQVEYIRYNHPRVAKGVCLTTWSGGMSITIECSDWRALDDRQFVIVVGPSREGFKKAHKIHKTLSRLGFKRIEFLMCWDSLALSENSSTESNLNEEKLRAFDNDLLKATLISGDVCKSSVFIEEARCRYGLKFREYHSRSIDLNELLSMKLPESTAVLAPIIMAGDKVMIFAHRGSGKTWLICFIVCAIGSGKSIFDGMYFAPNPLRILVFDGEMRLKKLQERYDLVSKSMDVPEHLRPNIKLRASSYEGRLINLETHEDREPFKDDIEWADVIVLDSVCFLFPNAMSGYIEGADGFNNFLNWCSLQGKTVIAVDHTGKSKKSSFGTSAKEFGLDIVAQLKKPKESKDEFTMIFTKGRNLGAKDKQDVKFSLSVDEDAGVANLVLLSEYDDDKDDIETEEQFNDDDFLDDALADGRPLEPVPADVRTILSGLDETNSNIVVALTENPDISLRALAKKVGTSKSTAQVRRKQLEDAGLVAPKPNRKGPRG